MDIRMWLLGRRCWRDVIDNIGGLSKRVLDAFVELKMGWARIIACFEFRSDRWLFR